MLGRWSFRHLDLAIDRRVLIPRPETEVVAGVAIELAAAVDGPRVVADLGTGSGAIGLSLASELPVRDTTVWLTDISSEALEVARANLAGIGRLFALTPNDEVNTLCAGHYVHLFGRGEVYQTATRSEETARQIDQEVDPRLGGDCEAA